MLFSREKCTFALYLVEKNVLLSYFKPRKMYRNKINELINWKLSKQRKPLIILGARQEIGRAHV